LELLLDRPDDEIKIYNMGVSGNKVFELAGRWRTECLNFKPTLLSILIGVNDFWHTLTGKYDGTLAIYERDYRALIQRTKAALPRTRLIICEPFALPCGAVDEKWFPVFHSYRSAARRVADSFGLTFIPFQSMFNEAMKYAPAAYWAADGVHPTTAGAALMAHNWLRIVAASRFP
jgi:lysophospholipase L1-like esterase